MRRKHQCLDVLGSIHCSLLDNLRRVRKVHCQLSIKTCLLVFGSGVQIRNKNQRVAETEI